MLDMDKGDTPSAPARRCFMTHDQLVTAFQTSEAKRLAGNKQAREYQHRRRLRDPEFFARKAIADTAYSTARYKVDPSFQAAAKDRAHKAYVKNAALLSIRFLFTT